MPLPSIILATRDIGFREDSHTEIPRKKKYHWGISRVLGDPQLELFCGQTLGAGLDSFPHTNLLGPLTELQTALCCGTVSTEHTCKGQICTLHILNT